jgi:hypothetical protein
MLEGSLGLPDHSLIEHTNVKQHHKQGPHHDHHDDSHRIAGTRRRYSI